MGFFDDLDRDLPDPIDPDAPLDEQLFGVALDRVEAGWVFRATLVAAARHERDQLEEEVEVRFTGGRFLFSARILERRGQSTRLQNETTRKLDREGIIELLQDQRRVARKLVEAAGGRMPGDVPRR